MHLSIKYSFIIFYYLLLFSVLLNKNQFYDVLLLECVWLFCFIFCVQFFSSPESHLYASTPAACLVKGFQSSYYAPGPYIEWSVDGDGTLVICLIVCLCETFCYHNCVLVILNCYFPDRQIVLNPVVSPKLRIA